MRFIFIISFFLFYSSGLRAFNVQIKNLNYEGGGLVSLDLSWDASWRLENGEHDAIWLFLKYREGINKKFDPLKIDSVESNSLRSEISANQIGIMLSRNDTDEGDITKRKLKVFLQDSLPAGEFEIRAYAIEMIFIPKGGFNLGDTASTNSFIDENGELFKVLSEDEINDLSSLDEYKPVSLPAQFPKGFDSFYAMKFEISQNQFVDFLNALSYRQQESMIELDPKEKSGTPVLGNGTFRNGIVIKSPASNYRTAQFAVDGNKNGLFNESGDGGNRACNFLSWNQLAAYLDWAGLRPMTELEFEKICRGPSKPVRRAYAWNTSLVKDANTVLNDGFENESVSEISLGDTGIASHGYKGVFGPLRNGFPASDKADRLQSGAAYYGNFEMSGNLWELVIATNNAGSLFKAENGDGLLSEAGYANQNTWPLNDAKGTGYRGGAWNSGVSESYNDLAISDRWYAFLKAKQARNTNGGRGVIKLK